MNGPPPRLFAFRLIGRQHNFLFLQGGHEKRRARSRNCLNGWESLRCDGTGPGWQVGRGTCFRLWAKFRRAVLIAWTRLAPDRLYRLHDPQYVLGP